MRIGKIALKIRAAKTDFGNYVAGTAELDLALTNTLLRESAFVIPLIENAEENTYDPIISQPLIERFGVIVALKNDKSQSEKLGLGAYDRIHDIREQILNCLLGWEISEAESMVFYRGGKLIDMNGAWLWYQFEFEYQSRLGVVRKTGALQTEIGAVGSSSKIESYSRVVYGVVEREVDQDQTPADFDTIYANYMLGDDTRLPYSGDLPIVDGFPDVEIPNMAQWIDLKKDPRAGDFVRAFGTGFDFYTKKY